jgi:hypothetical protein
VLNKLNSFFFFAFLLFFLSLAHWNVVRGLIEVDVVSLFQVKHVKVLCSLGHDVYLRGFFQPSDACLLFKCAQEVICLLLRQWRIQELDFDDGVSLFSHIEMNWRVRNVSQPWNLIVNFHSIERYLVEQTLVV